MKVRDLQLQPVVGTSPEEFLIDAADRMRFYEVGSLAVLEDGRLLGIITERDLARAVADGMDPEQAPVRLYMTEDPITIRSDADVREAAVMMLRAGVRHIPVVDTERLAGMVSVRDLLLADLAA